MNFWQVLIFVLVLGFVGIVVIEAWWKFLDWLVYGKKWDWKF